MPKVRSVKGEREFSFFQLQTRAEAIAKLAVFKRLESQVIGLDNARGRVAALDIISPEDLPPFARSTVDGFAVNARDTFGASEGAPALFEIIGEVAMGAEPDLELEPGQAARVWTGGMLPQGADAAVMVEYSRQVDQDTVELTRASAPGAHTIQAGEDVPKGRTLIKAGETLRAQEIGLLAALGVMELEVVRRPRAAIISTGNELVPAEETPGPGRIREVNSHTLKAQLESWGAEVEYLGLTPDDPASLKALVTKGLGRADMVLVSGGSSVGAADWTLRTFNSFEGAELLIQGVSISPGKPLILTKVGRKSLWGLPGHVTSAAITAEIFVRQMVCDRLLAANNWLEPGITATLSRNVASSPGREDWVRVRLEEAGEGYSAIPVLGSSGLISTLTKAHGLITIDLESEGLDAGTQVRVRSI